MKWKQARLVWSILRNAFRSWGANQRLSKTYSINGKRYVLVPVDPPPALLHRMAFRYDHGIGLPQIGEDSAAHSRRVAATLVTMRQLHDEVVNPSYRVTK